MYNDYGKLKKGDILPVWWLEQITGTKLDDKTYSLACVKVAKEIEAAIRREQGIEVFTKCTCGEIRILTDREAIIEAPSRHEQSVRKIRRTLSKASHIDTSELDEETRKRFEHNRRNMVYQADALTKARRRTGALLKNCTVQKPVWR